MKIDIKIKDFLSQMIPVIRNHKNMLWLSIPTICALSVNLHISVDKRIVKTLEQKLRIMKLLSQKNLYVQIVQTSEV